MTSTLPGFLAEENTHVSRHNHYPMRGRRSMPGLRQNVIQPQSIIGNLFGGADCAAIRDRCSRTRNPTQCIVNTGGPLCLLPVFPPILSM